MTKLRVFKTVKTAQAAIRKQGMHLMDHTLKIYCGFEGNGYIAVFHVDNAEDFLEVQNRGYRATMKTVNAAL